MNLIHNSEIFKLRIRIECKIVRKAEFKNGLTPMIKEG